jgi:thiosulfate/3-mercaptopyruvate sulfurtransferase
VHYDGVQATFFHREPVRKGHIPGAASVPYNSLFDDELRLRPAAELREIFAGAGVEPGQTVVGYCHLGQFATAMLFAARTLGYPVKLYDGSFQEWGRLESLPVEGPGAER